MHYHNYYPVDVVNGPGTRCTLFVSGCVHQCRGCYNKSTWRLDSGHLFTQQMEDQIIHDLNDDRIKRRGLSLSGGDPLHPENVSAVLKLVKRVREECPGKDIWLWSGYLLAELTPEQQAVIELVDVMIDGKFEKERHDPSLVWRGSDNQVIHYFKDIS
ncbi:anaerobic ribonucleotide reductase-activating protein [Photobacterium jeanii]|uniref:Anaerobic ribonucleoside-triphosphate reductase-activating protein n=1 Tax=Photobacterium jeanii TaxID=858640 RepID=A0A178K6V2_9GAMM|nr:anaerobic ribonucleoside-triphosphate reductase-activating protein [Photobacterium jeanii]OAN13011.1 anaerobic ribonucleotide reductase-activating protein [Photobacterium jeanii]PST89159.1 anaerobic ribonucleoside-triphosphate reductase-activating protein [Photobacterium jeanii]